MLACFRILKIACQKTKNECNLVVASLSLSRVWTVALMAASPPYSFRLPACKARARVDSLFRMPRASLVDDVNVHVRRLTMPRRVCATSDDVPDTVAAYELDSVTLSVPRWYAFDHFTAEVLACAVDATSTGDALASLEFLGRFTDMQERALASLEPTPESPRMAWARGGVLVLPCRFDRTMVALAYACRAKVRTLVVTGKAIRMQQWTTAARQFTNATIGIMQHSEAELCDITIATARSLRACAALARFGLVIVDDAHHVPTRVLWRVLSRVPAQQVIALVPRCDDDGLTSLLLWTAGPIVFRTSTTASEHAYAGVEAPQSDGV